MIDISKYRLLTPANSTLNIDEEITIYYRSGEIETFKNNNELDIDLALIAGVQTPDFNLVFKNHDEEFIKSCKKSEDWCEKVAVL